MLFKVHMIQIVRLINTLHNSETFGLMSIFDHILT